MTWIRVDPDEMTTTATALRSTADQLAVTNAGIRHDCSSCLPTQAEVLAEAVLRAVDDLLGAVGAHLALSAAELSARGATAAEDSLSGAVASTGAMTAIVGGSTFSDSISAPSPSSIGSLIGGSTFSSSISAPSPSSIGSLVGGSPWGPVTRSASSDMLGGALVGGPLRWRGPSPSELWSPSVGGGGVPGPIASPFVEPTPWALGDNDHDGVLNGQDRNPRLDDRANTDRDGLPDAFDRRDNDPRG